MEALENDGGREDAPERERRAAPLRLLVVDDDQVDRMTVRRGLRSVGVDADFEEAETFRDAVAWLRERSYDCVFLDFNLPGGDGLQVLREVRGAGIRTPVVMLTGRGDEQLAVELMKAGASDYLPKGAVSPERLAQSLRYVLRVQRAEMATRAAEAAREEAIAARGRFYAAMSHELRTPINAIIGYNELLLSSIYGELSKDQTRGIERSQRAARHLLELVNDVLDLSKLEAGKVDIQVEQVSMPALVDDLFTTIRPLADEHGCPLSFRGEDCSDRIRTDPRRVRQILLNLLSNAIKFGSGKPVEVRCELGADGGVVVEVEDEGGGMAETDLPRIFEEFVQLGGGEQSGTGLGLPISKRLAELLGGSLTVSSTVGVGSVFRLTLPAVLPPEEEGDTGFPLPSLEVPAAEGDAVPR
jgi:signal transduction histidine kinase